MTWEWSLKCVIIKLIYNVESLGLVYHPLNVSSKDNKTGYVLRYSMLKFEARYDNT